MNLDKKKKKKDKTQQPTTHRAKTNALAYICSLTSKREFENYGMNTKTAEYPTRSRTRTYENRCAEKYRRRIRI